MTIKKAISGLDFLIKNKQEMKEGLLDPSKSWNQGMDLPNQVAKGFTEVIDNDIEWFKVIRKQIHPLSKCKHPKKLHDRCEGKLYCMGYNQDL